MNAKQLLPLSGVVAVLLIVAAFLVGGESPETDDSLAEIVSYYADNEGALQVASGLLALGSFFFLIFTAVIGSLVRDVQRTSSFLAFAGGTIFVIGLTIFAGLNFAAAETVDDVVPTVTQALHVLNTDMFFTLALGTGAFLLGVGIGTLRTDALPSWLSWAAIVIGVVALTPAGFFGFIALGIWTLIVSVMLAMRAGGSRDKAPPRSTAPPTAT